MPGTGPTDLYALVPGLAMNDVVNRDRGHSVLPSKTALFSVSSCVTRANLRYKSRSEFGRYPSPHVLGMRNSFKVSGVHATSVAAKMVNLQIIRDGAMHEFVSNPVCRASSEEGVAPWIGGSTPLPTRSLVSTIPLFPGIRTPHLRMWRERPWRMSKDEPHRFSPNPSESSTRLWSYWRILAASALAQARGIRRIKWRV
jgi:hypothetical protein